MFSGKTQRTLEAIIWFMIVGVLAFILVTQVKACVTCDDVLVKTMWNTYACVDESALK
jgi:hypothetical protein